MHFVRTVVLRFNLHVEHFSRLMHLSTSPWSWASLTEDGALLAFPCLSTSNFFLDSKPSSLDTSDLHFSASLTCSAHLEPILRKQGRQKVACTCWRKILHLQPSFVPPYIGVRNPSCRPAEFARSQGACRWLLALLGQSDRVCSESVSAAAPGQDGKKRRTS